MLNADVEIGTLAAAYGHFANISYQLGRRLSVNQTLERFEDDLEANEMLTRDYREPYVVPEQV